MQKVKTFTAAQLFIEIKQFTQKVHESQQIQNAKPSKRSTSSLKRCFLKLQLKKFHNSIACLGNLWVEMFNFDMKQKE